MPDSSASNRARPLATPRFPELDALRGVAIVMMVAYHLAWDLDQLGDASLGVTSGGWALLARATATLFLAIVGVSLAVSDDRARRAGFDASTRARRHILRGVRILGYGLVITGVVALADLEGHIWFGILHLIGVAIVLAVPLLGRPRLALVAGIAVFAVTPLVRAIPASGLWLVPLGARGDAGRMLDWYPLAPWFGVVLLGVAAGHALYGGGQRRFPWPAGEPAPPVGLLAALGRRALPIYLLHQPVLIGALWAMGLVSV